MAKYINYDKNQEVKCVTLDGTVFHKAGLITGGQSGRGGGGGEGGGEGGGARRWEEKEMSDLRKARENLIAELKDIEQTRRGVGGSSGSSAAASEDAARDALARLESEYRNCAENMVSLIISALLPPLTHLCSFVIFIRNLQRLVLPASKRNLLICAPRLLVLNQKCARLVV